MYLRQTTGMELHLWLDSQTEKGCLNVEKKKVNPHAGHRQRMREKYYQYGIDQFAEHEVLEMMLYTCVARQNTNELAHRLIEQFGTLGKVIDAPLEELRKVEGVGETTAFFLHALPDFFMRYAYSSQPKDCTLRKEDIVPYMRSLFIGRKTECLTMLLLNSQLHVLYHGVINIGNIQHVSLPKDEIIRKIFAYHANIVYIAHNHPSGEPFPSDEDITTTEHLYMLLKSFNIQLDDHFVFTRDSTISIQKLVNFKESDQESLK